MKYLTNFSTNDTPPQISSFLTPSNKAKIQIPIIKSMDKPPKKDQQIIEDQIFQMKNNEIRSSKPKILSNLATREDVGALSKWLDSMVSRLLNEKNLNLQSLFENLQLVYSGCFQEIIRQVSIECFERGQLIQRIWNAYINLFERAIIEQSKEISSMEIEYLKESSRLHKLYQKEIERLNEVLAKTITEKEIAEAEALKLGENFKYAKKKNVQLEKDCIFFKINFENMRTEYNLINEDNIALKSLIEKNMQQEKKNEDVDYILRRMPKREKNISALIYDRSSFKKNRKNNEEKKNENELYQEENIDNVDDELYIEDKAIDTLDLQFLEEKATDTLDLGYNNFEKRGSGLVSDKKKRNDKISSENMVNYDNFKFSTDLENLKVTLQGTQNMLENKDFPNLTKVLSQPDISVDLRDEIIRALKLLSSFQEEIQDLKISLQERENKIEGLIEQKNKNEQELNLLSEEVKS